MKKKEIRDLYLAKRADLSSEEINTLSLKIKENFINSPFSKYENFHIFLPISSRAEVNTQPIIDYLWQEEKIICLPKVKEQELEHFYFTPSTKLEKNKWNILEPSEDQLKLTSLEIQKIEVVFIPLLAYDQKGQRVGYGGGFYDRFLAENPQVKKIGLSFFPPEDCIEDAQNFDIPLDGVITPEKLYDFPSSF